MITAESPDALEEMLWMAFFPRCHDASVSSLLGAADHVISPAAIRVSDLPDDRCLCCAPGIASPKATFKSPFLISSAVADRVKQPTLPEAQLIERPPRSQSAIS